VVKSSNPEFKKATVRINIFKQHRETIQVIDFYGLLLCNVFALHEYLVGCVRMVLHNYGHHNVTCNTIPFACLCAADHLKLIVLYVSSCSLCPAFLFSFQ
jgi:hypothetical protein